MTRFLFKTLVSALIIAGVSELGKRSSALAGILAALPLTTLMTMLWLYSDTRDSAKIAELSISVFWAVLPSFIFLLSLPLLLKSGLRFPGAFAISCLVMLAGYAGYAWLLRQVGIEF